MLSCPVVVVGWGSESGNVARSAKDCPKHVELFLEINKLLLLHLVGSSILLYLLIGFLILACMYVIVVS